MTTAGKTESALVTGGGSSVGRAVAERLSEAGTRVHICDVDADALASTLAANPALRGTVGSVDVPDDVARIAAEARAWLGDVTVLVNNVGIGGPRAAIEDVTTEEWRSVLETNVGGMFYCIRELAPAMKRARHGSIINVSSGSTRTGLPLRTPYIVSKYAVEGLTRNLARELGPFGIRVNAILPGIIDNDRMRSIMQRKADSLGVDIEDVATEYLRYISMGTLIQPSEIADTIAFLVSSAARHVTGQLVGVDGNLEWES